MILNIGDKELFEIIKLYTISSPGAKKVEFEVFKITTLGSEIFIKDLSVSVSYVFVLLFEFW